MLRCDGLDVSYGPVRVLFDVSVDVMPGEIVALLGTNGAGKSTLLKAAAGLLPKGAGTVTFSGEDITSLGADAVAGRGFALMPGGRGVFPTLTVAENLRLAGWALRRDPDRLDEARERVVDLFPILRRRWDELAGNLSGGEQQMLSLGGVLMTSPRMLAIDELSLGLAPTVVGELIEVVHRIHEAGTTILVVEQSVNVALELAERAVFMEKGQVRFTGPTAELIERPDILRSVFISGAGAGDGAADRPAVEHAATQDGSGRSANGDAPSRPGPRDEVSPNGDGPLPVLGCHGVVKRFGGIQAVDGVSLELGPGRICGLIGQNGAGKTTLFDCISGFLPLDGGRVVVHGRDVGELPPHERAEAGLGRSFQEARLYPALTVAETVAVALERHLASREPVAAALHLPASYESELAARDRVDELLELTGLAGFRDTRTGELSTGTRRIVELACVLAQEPSVLLLDEPSGGIAQRETEALAPLLLRVQEHTGCSLLVIEHDMPLLRSICDELVALELGAVIARGTPTEVLEHPRVIESYLGTNEAAVERSGAGAPAGGAAQ